MSPTAHAARHVALVPLALAISGCTAFTPRVDLSRIGPPLGAATRGDSCAHDASQLAAQSAEDWARDPSLHRLSPEWRCLALRDNLAWDTMEGCAPDPADVLGASSPAPQRIHGERLYLGIDPRDYAYDLGTAPDGAATVEVRIRFVGDAARDPATLRAMQEKLARAAALWSTYSPGQRARFSFRVVTDDAAAPHFTVSLDPGAPRSPYDVTWGAAWSWHLMAHEIGHMMGLDDEYGQLRKTLGHALGKEARWVTDRALKMDWLRCDLDSLMCDSKGEGSAPQRYHYYVILRRQYCHVRSEGYPALGAPLTAPPASP